MMDDFGDRVFDVMMRAIMVVTVLSGIALIVAALCASIDIIYSAVSSTWKLLTCGIWSVPW